MKTIYLDESGDNGLDFTKPGTKKYFIVAAIVIENENLGQTESQLGEISRIHFGKGPIKSKNIGSNFGKRIKILNLLNDLPFLGYAFVVNKELLSSKGFQYVRSFYKYLNKRVYDYLKLSFPEATLYADRHGSDDFMLSFKNYIFENDPLDLFNTRTFDFVESKENRFTQLADFIAGSYAAAYEEKPGTMYRKELLSVLMTKTTFDEWPRTWESAIAEYTQAASNSNDMDSIIESGSVRLAINFLAEHDRAGNQRNDSLVFDQCSFLNLLLFQHLNIDKTTYVSSFRVRERLAKARGISTISNYYLGTKVVGKLRSKGILIASNIRGGYKIPRSISDLYDFVNNVNSKVKPMIDRVGICWKHVKLITDGKVDILEERELRTLLSAIKAATSS